MINTPTSLLVAWCGSILWCCDVNGAWSEKCTVICGVCFVLLHASVCVCMCVKNAEKRHRLIRTSLVACLLLAIPSASHSCSACVLLARCCVLILICCSCCILCTADSSRHRVLLLPLLTCMIFAWKKSFCLMFCLYVWHVFGNILNHSCQYCSLKQSHLFKYLCKNKNIYLGCSHTWIDDAALPHPSFCCCRCHKAPPPVTQKNTQVEIFKLIQNKFLNETKSSRCETSLKMNWLGSENPKLGRWHDTFLCFPLTVSDLLY